MTKLSGYPKKLGGTVKYELKDIKISDGDIALEKGDFGTVTGPEGLGQKLDLHVLKKIAAGPTDQASVEKALNGVWGDKDVTQYYEAIESATIDNDVVSIVFTAVGYPDKYEKKIALNGPGGAYPLSTVK